MATAAVWDEVKLDETSEDFLNRCYVETDTTKGVIAQAEELLSKRFSIDKAARLEHTDSTCVSTIINHESAERPIIVLGKIGRGKSTYLQYLRKIKATATLKNYIQIDVNLLDRPDRTEEVSNYIYDEIERQLFEDYGIDISANNLVRGFLHIELQRFKTSYEGEQFEPDSAGYREAEKNFIDGIRANRHVYLTKVFNHLRRGQTFSVAIFLDNLDRRTDEIQEEAFLRASAMARDWSTLVFVCLRPGTFYRSSHFGVLDSVEPKVIHIDSPKTKVLIKKRMEYAKDVALGIENSTRTKQGAPFSPGISVHFREWRCS